MEERTCLAARRNHPQLHARSYHLRFLEAPNPLDNSGHRIVDKILYWLNFSANTIPLFVLIVVRSAPHTPRWLI